MTIYCCAVTHRPRWCVSLFLPHCLPPPGLHARYRGSHCWGQHPNYQGHSHNRAQGPRYISTTDTQNFNDKMSFKTRWKAGRFLQLIRYRGRSTSSHYQDFPIVWLGSLSKWSPGNEERELTGTPHMTADYPGQEMNVCIQANMSVATSSLGRGGSNEWEKKVPGVMPHSGRHSHAETGDLLWPEINRCQAAVMWGQHREGETEVDKDGKKQVISLVYRCGAGFCLAWLQFAVHFN